MRADSELPVLCFSFSLLSICKIFIWKAKRPKLNVVYCKWQQRLRKIIIFYLLLIMIVPCIWQYTFYSSLQKYVNFDKKKVLKTLKVNTILLQWLLSFANKFKQYLFFEIVCQCLNKFVWKDGNSQLWRIRKLRKKTRIFKLMNRKDKNLLISIYVWEKWQVSWEGCRVPGF